MVVAAVVPVLTLGTLGVLAVLVVVVVVPVVAVVPVVPVVAVVVVAAVPVVAVVPVVVVVVDVALVCDAAKAFAARPRERAATKISLFMIVFLKVIRYKSEYKRVFLYKKHGHVTTNLLRPNLFPYFCFV